MSDLTTIPAQLEKRIDALADSARLTKPKPQSAEEIHAQKERITALLKKNDAVLVSHYYVDSTLQELADETGGTVSDSLDMAKFGMTHSASTVVVAGVKCMPIPALLLRREQIG